MSGSEHTGMEGRPGLRLLSNGRYGVLVSAAGGGYSAFDGFALTRWQPDPTRDADGVFLYLRDPGDGAVWSAGYQPTRRAPARYEVHGSASRVEIVREDDGVETRTEIVVAAGDDVELRRVTLTNRSARARRLELTSYAEVVLNTPAGDAGHPAFSKLFVQTAYLPEHDALLAWRRLRSPGDRPLFLIHRLDVVGADAGAAEYETDRMRFLGRGRTPADPAALDADASLSGATGNVLDPVFALRRSVELAPGGAVSAVLLLAAAPTREAAEALAARYRDPAAVAAAFAAPAEATEAKEAAVAALGLPEGWMRRSNGALTPRPPLPMLGEGAGGEGVVRSQLSTLNSQLSGGGEGVVRRQPAAGSRQPTADSLRFFNGFGGFSADGSEYVIRLVPGEDGRLRLPPLPWTNVVANEQAGFLASERGAGYTWAANSRENRVTPWANDPVSDPHGEALYLRDERTGEFWSPLPGPAPAAAPYEVRHGFGYSTYHSESHGLEQEVTLFVPRHDPLRVALVRLTNHGAEPRELALYSYAHLVLGVLPQETRGRVQTSLDAATGALFAVNRERGEFSGRAAFASVVPAAEGVSHTADRAAFLGEYGDAATPAAVAAGRALDGRVGAHDPCAAHRVPLSLAPGESAEVAFLLGEADDETAARQVLRRYPDVASLRRALDEVRGFWRETVSAVQAETPAPEIDLMLNGWLAYQNLACRIWGRSAFYQSGGAFGFRDQLQDSSAFVYLQPELTRRQIVLHAGHQFAEGDVLHWWHPPLSKGMRTRFSDDLLWLPYITSFYVRTTGDASVLDEPARFVTARQLEPGEDEVFVVPEDSGSSASVYEHCCRALDRSLTRGAHGLPLMGVGDWNDGMNRVGREGRGESVWLGFFLYQILSEFLPCVEQRGDAARAERYRAYLRDLGEALNDTGWDGEWYRRAYYDDGAPLGSKQSDECRIDTIAQAWSVLSGAAPPERAALALDAMEEHLVSEDEGIIRLLTPAFDRTPHDPGYIKGYLPGVRENGGQYTHGALWAVRALAEFGRAERAARLLSMVSPVSHARTPEEVAVYQVDPYVIAADVYGVAPHVGRGGWTWYTGSAGWMFRVALESVLGFDLRDGRTLALKPALPPSWPGFTLRWRAPWGGAVYEIDVRREGTETRGTLDGRALLLDADGAVLVPLAHAGGTHAVEVVFAREAAVRYRER